MKRVKVNISALIYIILFAFIFLAIPAMAQQEAPKAGGQPVLLIDGAWNPQPGAWGLYHITDKKTGKVSSMQFTTLERGEYDGKQGRWLEITVRDPKAGEVVTRVLMEENSNGPTKVLEAIVQPEGHDPFTIPDSMLEDAEQGVENDFKPIKVDEKVKKITYKYKGKKYPAWKVRGKDQNNQPVLATVSEHAPPLGLLYAETADVKMKLKKYGGGATTRIKGEPINFYLWITNQIADALSKAGDSGQ